MQLKELAVCVIRYMEAVDHIGKQDHVFVTVYSYCISVDDDIASALEH